jgi:FMN hydrolase / 5-amino-6-(5-phospho-D-ribitylamino)uracil phosphatase
MIKPLVLSFDLDDTLWAVAPVMLGAEGAMLAWLQENHPALMQRHNRESLRLLRMGVAERFPERSHDFTFLRQRTLQEMFRDSSNPQALAEQAFEVFYAARNNVKLYDEVESALRRLRSRYRLFAVSNGNADLQRCGIAHFFEGHVTAINAGAAKPDARIFSQLCAIAGVQAAQVLHIGDDPHADVVGATQAGLQAAWLNRDAKDWPSQYARPARTISTLDEII